MDRRLFMKIFGGALATALCAPIVRLPAIIDSAVKVTGKFEATVPVKGTFTFSYWIKPIKGTWSKRVFICPRDTFGVLKLLVTDKDFVVTKDKKP